MSRILCSNLLATSIVSAMVRPVIVREIRDKNINISLSIKNIKNFCQDFVPKISYRNIKLTCQ